MQSFVKHQSIIMGLTSTRTFLTFVSLSGSLLFQSQVHCDHIVFLHTCSSYSHRVPQWPLVEALISRGHKVTYISPFAGGTEMSHPKVQDIIPGHLHYLMEGLILGNVNVQNRIYGLLPKSVFFLELVAYISCREMFRSSEFQQWLNSTLENKENKVDLIFADSFAAECSYGLAKKLGAKHALFLTLPFVTKYFESFGIPAEMSSIPDWEVSYRTPLSFWNRVVGATLPIIWRMNQVFHYKFAYAEAFRRNLGLKGSDIPDLYEMEESTSLVLINGDYLEDYPRSYPSFVVKVPGIHVKPNLKYLPIDQEVDRFLNQEGGGINDGFIYISFGTVAKGHNLPDHIRQVFFSTIEEFANLRFIWSWNGPHPENTPKNLLLVPWLNQQNLLAHPKIKAFVTQGGRPSMQEAFSHGVPTITFPILADQDFNAHRYENLGSSICLDIATANKPTLVKAINSIMANDTYKKRTEELSKLGKDVPMPPVELATWWTEFVLRHSTHELNLMRPPSHRQSWYEKRNLDVWAFLGASFLCSLWALLVLFKYSWKLFVVPLFLKYVKSRFIVSKIKIT